MINLTAYCSHRQWHRRSQAKAAWMPWKWCRSCDHC